MLREHTPADEPGRERESKPSGSRQRVGVQDHVAAVERKRKHGHRPLGEKLILAAINRDKRRAAARGKGDERGTFAQRSIERPHSGTGKERVVERDDAVGKVLAEAEHETHEEMRRGDAAELFGWPRAAETRDADQSLGLDRLAHLADLIAPPQHRQHGDAKPRAPGSEQRQRLKR